MPRIVVLGTGTGVGKSHVTTALARSLAFAEPHAAIGALKPIESGMTSDAVGDAASLEQWFRKASPPSPHPLFGYRDALTPLLAARRESREEPEVDAVRRWLSNWEARAATFAAGVWAIVETAGGVFSPLTGTTTNLELAIALEPCAWVLVGSDSLGTLHETTATIEAMRRRGRAPDHVVLSAARSPDASTGTNASLLAETGVWRDIATLGRGEWDLSSLAKRLAETARAP